MLGALAALGGGCLGMGSAGSSGVNPGGPDQVVPAARVVTLSWPVATLSHSSDAARRACPADDRCLEVHRGPGWWTVRQRTLRCPVHAEAGTDCAALITVVHAVRHQHVFCPCALSLGPSDRIQGSYRGHPIDLPLTSCNVCGAPRAVTRAFAQLFPR